MHNILGTHPLFFLFSRFLLKSYIRKICNIYAVAYCIFQLPLYSSPYNFIYTSLAIVAAAGDIAHETDNIDKQVKINRLHTKQYSDKTCIVNRNFFQSFRAFGMKSSAFWHFSPKNANFVIFLYSRIAPLETLRKK